MRLFRGVKQEGALPPSLLLGLFPCLVTIWKRPWKFKLEAEASKALHQAVSAQPRVGVPGWGTTGPRLILGSRVSFLLRPGISDFCVHLGAA